MVSEFGSDQDRHLIRSILSPSSAISVCETGGEWEQALRLMREMETKSIELNTITYSSAVSACDAGGALVHCDALYAQAYSVGALDHQH